MQHHKSRAKLTGTQRTVLDWINGGMSELEVLQAAGQAVGITENETYWAAKYLRQNGYVKGRQAPPLKPREGGAPFRWTYHPLSEADIKLQNASYEERKAAADKILADWQGRNKGVKPPPAPFGAAEE